MKTDCEIFKEYPRHIWKRGGREVTVSRSTPNIHHCDNEW